MNTTTYNCQLISVADKQSFAVTQEMIVGRGDQCDLIIKLGQTSRKHARLSPGAEGLWVEDLQSSNGTFVDGKAVIGKVLAKHGSLLKFDTVCYNVVFESQHDNDISGDDTTVVGDKSEDESAKRASTLPPSWAMEREQAVDGTQILGASGIAGLQANQATKVEKVSIATLVGLSAPIEGKRFILKPDVDADAAEWSIGRGEASFVCIDHPSVSSNHAQLISDGNRWKLVDLVSANGTFVNGNKGLTTFLKSGDKVCFGQVECQILLPIEVQARQSTTVKREATTKKTSPLKPLLIGATLLAAIAVVLALAFK
ncbi:FHA domain-containing protein [Simiduia curdlanivorans]|uniref:FHA domain-containing protein n=1 Tax=Simiduia curdlanivorans TaxID=1492769 RepID=A0ABV8V0K7_9GAMM|nr:FHA domain-containing protein [Simiduia curdlanivorans]MDN3640309.1 FHA domain-containing protein [Simiduia curdlanivorans]